MDDHNERNEPVQRLTKDLAQAARTLTDTEARFLVDAYYIMQEDRKRSAAQTRQIGEEGEPNSILAWFAKQNETLEHQIQRALDRYTEAHPIGGWLREIVGIGPVIAAGLLAHINLQPWYCAVHDADDGEVKCRPSAPHGPECRHMELTTAGKLWRFAGLDPTIVWEKGKRRPYNAKLKTLCWKIGESFIKLSNREDCYYGHVYRKRKEFEQARSDSGACAEYAKERAGKVGKNTEAYKAYSEGRLPPGQINARARRYAVKLFLAHLHEYWYTQKFGKKPPLPYPIESLGHKDYIAPPNAEPGTLRVPGSMSAKPEGVRAPIKRSAKPLEARAPHRQSAKPAKQRAPT
jgi:hypothetical protein